MTIENKWTVLMQKTEKKVCGVPTQETGIEAIEPEQSQVISQEIPPQPTITEEANPFMSSDEQTAIDVTDKLSTFDKESLPNNVMKAILKDTLGVVACLTQAHYAAELEKKYNFQSKVKLFNEWLTGDICASSTGFKGQRAQQAFEAVKAVNTQNFMMGGMTENGGKSKKDKLLGR